MEKTGRKIKVIVINHGHLDIEWYKTLDAYRFWAADIIDTLSEEAAYKENYETYTFDGSVFLLDDLIRYFPHYKERIEQLVRTGKLLIGPFYTQFDEWIPSGECMVRNCLWGNRKSLEYGAQPMRVGYLPDNFGHPRQLPQILRNFGIDSLLFTRGMVDIDEGREFHFIGADDSELIAVNYNYATHFLSQNNDPEDHNPRCIPYFDETNVSYERHTAISVHKDIDMLARQMIEAVKGNIDLYSQDVMILPMGSDHCPPQVALGDTVALANELQDEIEFVFASPEEYVEALRNAEIECRFKGELLGCKTDCILLGVLAARIYQKIDIFAAETLLFKYALPLLAMYKLAGEHNENFEAILRAVTENVLVNSTHDSVHGSSIDPVHKEMEARNIFSKQSAAEVVLSLLNEFSACLGKWWADDERSITVYNASSKTGKQVCSIWLPVGDGDVAIFNADRQCMECAVHEREPAVLNAKGKPYYPAMPSMQYRKVDFLAELKPFTVETFAWKCIPGKQPEKETASEEYRIENEYFCVTAKGALIDIFDKGSNVTYAGFNLLKDLPDAGDVWDCSEPYIDYPPIRSDSGKVESVRCQKGSVSEKIEIKGRYYVPEKLIGDDRSHELVAIGYRYEIVLWKGIPRVDVKLSFDNKAKDHITFLELPFPFRADSVLSQGAFCANERKVVPYGKKAGWVVPPTEFLPFNEWVALKDGRNGMAIAFKGLCTYKVRHEGESTILSVPVNRSIGEMSKSFLARRGAAPSDRYSINDAQCIRETEIEWSYIPYQYDADNHTPFLEEAESFLYPPVGLCQYKGRIAGEFRKNRMTPFSVKGDVRVSLFDRSYDGEYFLLRLYENNGQTAEVEIHLENCSEAYLANMNEEITDVLTTAEGDIRITAEPYKIITILWR